VVVESFDHEPLTLVTDGHADDLPRPRKRHEGVSPKL
jgi:hypothetical protein